MLDRVSTFELAMSVFIIISVFIFITEVRLDTKSKENSFGWKQAQTIKYNPPLHQRPYAEQVKIMKEVFDGDKAKVLYTPLGFLKYESVYRLRSRLEYFCRACTPLTDQREERRAHLQKSQPKEWEKCIQKQMMHNQKRLQLFTVEMLNHLNIDQDIYYAGLSLIPACEMTSLREESLLYAYLDSQREPFMMLDRLGNKMSLEDYFYRGDTSRLIEQTMASTIEVNGEKYVLNKTKDSISEAHQEFSKRMEAFWDKYKPVEGPSSRQLVDGKTDVMISGKTEDVVFDRYKIEDEIAEKFSVEVDHLIAYKNREPYGTSAKDRATKLENHDDMIAAQEALLKLEDQPLQIWHWNNEKRAEWFDAQFKLCKQFKFLSGGTIPFVTFTQVMKVMQQQTSFKMLEMRRDLLKKGNLPQYESCIELEIAASCEIEMIGLKRLQKTLGIEAHHLIKSNEKYLSDVKKRQQFDLIMATQLSTVQQAADAGAGQAKAAASLYRPQSLTLSQTIEAMTALQNAELSAYEEAFGQAQKQLPAYSKQVPTIASEAKIQAAVYREVTKVQDKLFVEQNFSMLDIERSIIAYGLTSKRDILYQLKAMHESKGKNRQLKI